MYIYIYINMYVVKIVQHQALYMYMYVVRIVQHQALLHIDMFVNHSYKKTLGKNISFTVLNVCNTRHRNTY